MRFNTDKFRSLNETISHIDQPQVPADEYTELLESVLLALCAELELDPDVLLEDFQTPERAAEMKTKRKRSQGGKVIKSKEAAKKLAARKIKETKRKAAEIKFDKKNAAARAAYLKKPYMFPDHMLKSGGDREDNYDRGAGYHRP